MLKFNTKNLFFLFVSSLMLLPGMVSAQTACIANPTFTARMSLGNITVPPTTQVGQSFYSMRSALPPQLSPLPPVFLPETIGFYCGDTVSYAENSALKKFNVQVFPGVYKTNVEGVGIKITTLPDESGWGNPITVFPRYVAGGASHPNGNVFLRAALGYVVTLYKTGPIGSGTLQLETGEYASRIYGRFSLSSLQITGGTIVPPPVPTCSINVGDVNKQVALATVSVQAFNQSNTAGNTRFSIGVENCRNAASATFTFSGDPDMINPALFKNTITSTAGFVGIELRSVPGGEVIRADGANNSHIRMVNIDSASQKATLNLAARYRKTSPNAAAGRVASRATFTMSYQ